MGGETKDIAIENGDDSTLSLQIDYRIATPTDIVQCFQLEQKSNLSGEAATKNDLQYWQHHAAKYFMCCVIENEDDGDVVVGFICSTRLNEFKDYTRSLSHRPNGEILMIQSMVVAKEYQGRGFGKNLIQNYIDAIQTSNASAEYPISTVVTYAKQEFLTFFLHAGFSVVRPCEPVDKKERLYQLEMSLRPSGQHQDTATNETNSKSNGTKCFVVDSFAAKPGTGNPAAVVLLPKDTNQESLAKWMQTVAAEFNLSETAFCWPQRQVSSHSSVDLEWNIRFYSPTVEVSLCGHATLASAAVLYQNLKPRPNGRIVFNAREDTLIMNLAAPLEEKNKLQTQICMEFPVKQPTELSSQEDKAAVEKMLEASFSCKIQSLYIGISDIGDVLVEVTPDCFWQIGYDKLNYKALLEWDGYDRGVIVCCIDHGKKGIESADPDFYSRFFGPKAGINEDPVTGSAHCVLAPYFSNKLNKNKIVGKQMSERGGVIKCTVSGDTVKLTGTAITSMSGTLWM